MRFASIGSGSKGNGCVVRTDTSCLLIDCGFSAREAERRLRRLEIEPQELDAILVTHEHGDHIRGVRNLARKHQIPVYLSHGTSQALEVDGLELDIINTHRSFDVGEFTIEPVPVPHDAREPCQFVVCCGALRLGVLSDLGHISPAVLRHYRNCDALMLESNYDPAMLAAGPYPFQLKQRVGGDWGHLSNQQAAGLLQQVERGRLQHLVMGHISEKNNSSKLVEEMLAEFSDFAVLTELAEQENGIGWRALN